MNKKYSFKVFILLLLGGMLMSSCHEEKITPIPNMVEPRVIFDTDLGSSTDDLFAMQLLYRYHDMGQCMLLGIVVDRMGENNARIADVMNTYYGHGNMPIGLERQGVANPQVWIDYSDLPNYRNEDGSLMFQRTRNDYSSVPDGWKLYRQLLSAQPDHSVSIVSVGFVTSLARLLQSEGDEYSPLNGVDLVRKKVKCAYLMGGVFGEAVEPDYNFLQAIDFSRIFFQLWPKDVNIIFSPGEVGDAIEYKPEKVIADISWTDVHPIKQVYMNCDCNTGQKMWDPMPVFNAVLGDSLFYLSERGTVVYDDEGMLHFTADPRGNCRYQEPGSQQWAYAMLQRIRQSNTAWK